MDTSHASPPAPEMSGRPRLEASVIIPAYEVEHLIVECLDAIGLQIIRGRHELILVDDASSDGTSAAIDAWSSIHPEVPLCLLVAPRRGGPNASRNAGSLCAEGRLLAFTDGDDMVHAGWVDAMVRAGAHAAFLAGAVHELETDSPVTREFRVATINYAQGNSMAVSRELVMRVEGFDPRILRGGTEVEFAARLKEMLAVTPTPVPDAITLYRQSTSRLGVIRRIFQRQRGHVLLGRLHPRSVPPDSPLRSIREDVRLIRMDLWSMIRHRSPDRSATRYRLVRCASSIVWIIRFGAVPPRPRPRFDTSLDGYRIVVDRR